MKYYFFQSVHIDLHKLWKVHQQGVNQYSDFEIWQLTAASTDSEPPSTLLLFSPPLMILSELVSSNDRGSWQSLYSEALNQAALVWLRYYTWIIFRHQTPKRKDTERHSCLWSRVTLWLSSFWMAFGCCERGTKLWSAKGDIGEMSVISTTSYLILYVAVMLVHWVKTLTGTQ